MNQYASKRGYALILSTLLLAAAATGMVAIGRVAWHTSAEAIRAKQELQSRWGTISLERAVLFRSSSVARALDASAGSVEQEIQLGDMHLKVTISDEHVKLNLARLWSESAANAQAFTGLIAQWFGASATPAPRIRPSVNEGSTSLRHWLEDTNDFIEAESMLTCHSDGRLNVRRCPEARLRVWLERFVGRGTSDRFLNELRRDRDRPIGNIIEALALSSDERIRLTALVRDDTDVLAVRTSARQSLHVLTRQSLLRSSAGGWHVEVVEWR
jgi:hypothetical protein